LETAGPQTKNLTVPVTGPFAPERVAVSVTVPCAEPDLAHARLRCENGRDRQDPDAFNERSWLPSWASSSVSKRMWYGEPEIALALLPAPQSICEAMCPPQAITTVGSVAVKLTITALSASGASSP
jgi:hypothetical protein